ncbi:hypothetical protein B0H17DRAFT_1221453 [Mycena rosella]|uniref:Uncharacterized protein n=1 Tax=Mycena rosella TaxID=1033263 RepID=A0AAD7B295_MYCRO|nr:hypothetical protein B0H17DRAFT_1221453 [Mycena rosella]
MVPLTVGAGMKPTLTHCFSTHFVSPKCITLGLDAVLPFVLILTLGSIPWMIYYGAHTLVQAAQTPRQTHVTAPFKKANHAARGTRVPLADLNSDLV